MKTLRICIDFAGAEGNDDNLVLKVFHYNENNDLIKMSPTHLRQAIKEPYEVEVSFGDGQETVDATKLMDVLRQRY